MLSPQLLELLRAWWREGRRRSLLLPGGWLFPGRNPVEPLSARQLCRVVRGMSQRELGNLVGASREKVNRQLQVWRRAGIITIEEGTILIRDPAALLPIDRPRRMSW